MTPRVRNCPSLAGKLNLRQDLRAWCDPIHMTLPAIPAIVATTDSMIAWLYILTNAARVVTYVPQLMAVWRSTDGARDIALLTWGSWVVANATAVAYGFMVIHDTFFTSIAMLNLVCCAAVTIVGAQRRRTYGSWRAQRPLKQRPPEAPAPPAGFNAPRPSRPCLGAAAAAPAPGRRRSSPA